MTDPRMLEEARKIVAFKCGCSTRYCKNSANHIPGGISCTCEQTGLAILTLLWPRSIIAQAVADERERCAKIAEGIVYYQNYRTWEFPPFNGNGENGNQSEESEVVQQCDRIAAAIRAVLKGEKL